MAYEIDRAHLVKDKNGNQIEIGNKVTLFGKTGTVLQSICQTPAQEHEELATIHKASSAAFDLVAQSWQWDLLVNFGPKADGSGNDERRVPANEVEKV